MIKKIVLWLIACVSAFVGFSNAWSVLPVWSYSQSPYNSSYEINVINKWSFLSQYLWQTKDVLYYRLNDFFIWDQAWNLYAHLQRDPNNTNTLQIAEWYFNQYYVCDEITPSSTAPVNCSLWASNIVNDSDIINDYKSFLKTVKSSDYFMIDDWTEYQYWTNPACRWLALCVSSSSIGKSMCWGFTVQYGSVLCNKYSVQYFPWLWGLTGSVWLWDIAFWRLNGYPSPAVDWSIVWWGQIAWWSTLTWNMITTNCPNSQALLWYRWNWYLNRMCYSSYSNTTDIFTWVSDYTVWFELTWVNIRDLYNSTSTYRRYWSTGDSMDYLTWFNYWRKSFDVYQKNQWEITNPFTWVPVSLFLQFWNINAYALPYNNASITEFCDLALWYVDLNSDYTWVAYDTVCSLTPIQVVDLSMSVWNTDPDSWIPTWYSGWTVWNIWSSWDWITNRSWYWLTWTNELSTITDWSQFLNIYFNNLQKYYKYSTSTNKPIIPNYILIALCWIILFRFLRR